MKRIGLQDLAEMVDRGRLNTESYCHYCRKIRYETRDEAAKAGARIAALGKAHSRPYPCPRRDGWHLTSEPHQTSKAQRKRRSRERWRRIA